MASAPPIHSPPAGFMAGTRLLTPNGYAPVETFKPGDPIVTRQGIRRAVRRIEPGETAAVPGDGPVTILPGAFGPGLPAQPVRLAPAHAIFSHGVLVPIGLLANGEAILRERVSQAVRCFLPVLDLHELLIAEGLPVESGLPGGDCAGRCARLLAAGPELARLRRLLRELAQPAGVIRPATDIDLSIAGL